MQVIKTSTYKYMYIQPVDIITDNMICLNFFFNWFKKYDQM